MRYPALRARAKNGILDSTSTYKQNLVAINTYAVGVSMTTLPSLQYPPSNYGDFQNAYIQAQSQMVTFMNKVVAHLLAAPDSIDGSTTSIQSYLNTASQEALALQQDPSDYGTRTSLLNHLQLLLSAVQQPQTVVSGLVTGIQTLKNNLPDYAQQLTSIANQATQDQNVDAQKVQSLNTQITNLNADVQKLSKEIAEAQSSVKKLTIGGIGVSFLGLVGGLLQWLWLSPAVKKAEQTIGLDSAAITNDKSQIGSLTAEMNGYTQDAASLSTTSTNFTNLANEASNLAANVQQVLAAWQAIAGDIQKVIDDVNSATTDTNTNLFASVADDLANAAQDWATTDKDALALKVDINVNSAGLQLGWSSDAVSQALTGGSEIPVIQYINSLNFAAA